MKQKTNDHIKYHHKKAKIFYGLLGEQRYFIIFHVISE